jgi:hypothetical protein
VEGEGTGDAHHSKAMEQARGDAWACRGVGQRGKHAGWERGGGAGHRSRTTPKQECKPMEHHAGTHGVRKGLVQPAPLHSAPARLVHDAVLHEGEGLEGEVQAGGGAHAQQHPAGLPAGQQARGATQGPRQTLRDAPADDVSSGLGGGADKQPGAEESAAKVRAHTQRSSAQVHAHSVQGSTKQCLEHPVQRLTGQRTLSTAQRGSAHTQRSTARHKAVPHRAACKCTCT